MKHQIFIVFVLGCSLFTACTPKYYTANTQNVPLITSIGETNLTFAGNTDQVEFQGAYGVTNGFAVKADGSFFIPDDNYNGDGGSGKFFELGGGYFKPLANNFVFETYGIVGLGSLENHFPSTLQTNPQTTGKITANVIRYGIQPNFGYKSKYFSAAISSRFVHLAYNNIKGDLIFNGENQVAYLNERKSNYLLEPALTLKAGLKKIKLQLQIGGSYNVSNHLFKQNTSFLTMGLNFNFK